LSEYPCRLYISAPAGHPVGVLTTMLDDALAAHDVAAVLYSTDNGVSHEGASTLMQCAMDHEVAFIVKQDIVFAREIGADGVHITGDIEVYKKARSALGDNSIIGLTTALNRHDSMCFGEVGADYIYFDPDIPGSVSTEKDPSLEGLIDWWSGLFEVACVAQAQRDVDQNRALINAGVDFLCLDSMLWQSKENATQTLKTMSRLIAECGRE
jgi:thiamine-phosphate pyrophosphorylase